MNVFKCFTAVWVSIIIYSLLSAFFGAASFSAYEVISSERDRLAKNMDDLRAINRDLEGSLTALQYDSDTIAVYARELGYGTRDERFVRIVGLPVTSKKRVTAGQQVLPLIPEPVSDKNIHIISLFAGVFTLVLFFAADLRKKRMRKNNMDE